DRHFCASGQPQRCPDASPSVSVNSLEGRTARTISALFRPIWKQPHRRSSLRQVLRRRDDDAVGEVLGAGNLRASGGPPREVAQTLVLSEYAGRANCRRPRYWYRPAVQLAARRDPDLETAAKLG